jgi:hypothetical protein
VEVRQACSRALRAWARIRDTRSKLSITQDSFGGDNWMATSWQWRLGSLYFPQQPVKALNISSYQNSPIAVDVAVDSYIEYDGKSGKYLDNAKETYVAALEMFGKYTEKGNTTSVSFDKYLQGSIPLYNSDTSRAHGTNLKVVALCSEAAGFQGVKNNIKTTPLTVGVGKGTSDSNYFHHATVSLLKSDNYRKAEYIQDTYRQYFFNDIYNFKKIYPILKSYAPYIPFVQATRYAGNHSIIPVNLERSTMFNLSGVPINNIRVLGLTLNLSPQLLGQVYDEKDTPINVMYPAGSKYNHEVIITLQYIKLARVFLNNVEIEQ